MADYDPQPLDVKLPQAVLDMIEPIARLVHDAWAHTKRAQGFTRGEPDGTNRAHPDLVPFDELTEEKKDLDREIALQTLRAFRSMGGRLELPEHEAPGHEGPSACASDADAELKAGHPLRAYEVLRRGLERWPDSHVLNQVFARTLQQSGDLKRAAQLLRRLSRDKRCDRRALVETFGLYGSTSKMLAMRASGEAAEQHRDDALDAYRRAFDLALEEPADLDGALYAGINVATFELLAGAEEPARATASRVEEICERRLAQLRSRDTDRRRAGLAFWTLATLGEAALILGKWDEAGARYRTASGLARTWRLYGALGSPRAQARRLLERLGRDPQPVLDLLEGPRVLVVHAPSGTIDSIRGFPRRLREIDPAYLYCSAAPGAEMEIVQQALDLDRRPEVHVVLPCPREEYRRAFGHGAGRWLEQFDALMAEIDKRSDDAEVAKESDVMEVGVGKGLRHRHALDYAARITLGRAMLRARRLQTGLTVLAAPGSGELWRDAEELQLIEFAPIEIPLSGEAEDRPHEVMAVLFADAVKFSALDEGQLPLFCAHFLGGVARVLAETGCTPVVKNTWGDGLYFVFRTVTEAGRVALALADFVNGERWERRGLPGDLNIRVALHCGPTYSIVDPVTNEPNVMGAHVSRAARIEPITPPGQVYASYAFAAMALLDDASGFVCDFVGNMQLAKNYGSMGVYHVRAI